MHLPCLQDNYYIFWVYNAAKAIVSLSFLTSSIYFTFAKGQFHSAQNLVKAYNYEDEVI